MDPKRVWDPTNRSQRVTRAISGKLLMFTISVTFLTVSTVSLGTIPFMYPFLKVISSHPISSDWSSQSVLWSHLLLTSMHCPSSQVNWSCRQAENVKLISWSGSHSGVFFTLVLFSGSLARILDQGTSKINLVVPFISILVNDTASVALANWKIFFP